jgi:hypothetical protein
MGGTKQIVSVDSEKRGVKVFADAEGKRLVGTTPFFWRKPRKATLRLFLENGTKTPILM